MEIKEIKAKTILTNCKIPGIDWVVNPYMGCSFGCIYCYASFMGRFIKGKSIDDWGEYVMAKVNAGELLKKEIQRKLKDKGKGKEIFFSSVTDPYQGMEAKYQLTRKCLEVLVDFSFEGYVSILTKSHLVLRDIDVFKKFKHIFVGITITSTDDSISRYFEKKAPNVSDRFKALKKLNEAGIRTYAFIGPLLPHFVADEAGLEKVFKELVKTGTKDIFIEHLNLTTYIKNRLIKEMKGSKAEILEKFYQSQNEDYRSKLDVLVKRLVKKYKMNLLTDTVIFHKEYQERESGKKNPFGQTKGFVLE